MWSRWIPEIAVEVVSASSADRDCVEKREEYWVLGVKEYWIVDLQLEQVMTLRRGRTKWAEKKHKRGDVLESRLLPGFQLPVGDIFDAAGTQENE